MIFNVEEQRIINNSDDYIEGDNIVIDNILRYHLEALLDRGFWILDFGIGTGGKSDMIYLSVDNDLPLDDVPEQFSRIDEYNRWWSIKKFLNICIRSYAIYYSVNYNATITNGYYSILYRT